MTVTATATLTACKLDFEDCGDDCDPTATSQATEPAETTDGTTETGMSPTTDGTTETDGETEGTTDTGGPGVCPCILEEADQEPPSEPICGETLCPAIEVWDDSILGICSHETDLKPGDSLPLVNPEALACALTALRDRTPGIIRWECGSSWAYDDSGYVLIGEDGTAIRRHWGAADLSYYVFDALQGALPDPAVFEQCLADEDQATRFECLRKFMFGEPLLVCDAGWAHHSD